MKSKTIVFLFSMLIVPMLISVTSCGKSGVDSNVINIGALSDETGGTADVGKDYARGIKEAIRYVNENGGINGKQIKLFQDDYGYKVPEALILYNKYKEKKCIAILGWGTADTEALSSHVAKDKIPYVSASYSAHLTDPKKTPFNFFIAPDYSTQVRGLLTAWFDKVWTAKKLARKPKVIFAFFSKSPFSTAAIKAGKEHANMLGFEVGDDADISLKEVNASDKINQMKKFKPDVVVHTNTVASVAVTIRDAFAGGLGADHLIKNWGFDESLPKRAEKAAEGVYGCAPWAFFGQNVPLMDKVKEYAKKVHPDVKESDRTIHTVQAWANVLALAEALKRADVAKDLSGDGIVKKGFETFKNLDLGLGISLINYTATDHRPQSEAKIYQFKGGKFNLFDSVDIQKKWPAEWATKWLGY